MRLYPTNGRLTLSLRPYFSLAGWDVQQRWIVLSVLGALSLVTYWLGLLLPYSLFSVDLTPGQSVATLTRERPFEQASLVLTTVALWSFYLLAWALCRLPARRDDKPAYAPWPMWAAVVGTGLAAAFWLVWLYPLGSSDIFDSIAYGRMVVVWGGNPFYETISQYNDPLAVYAGWPFATSAYGPLWVMAAIAAAAIGELAGGSVLAHLIVFKLMGVLFYGGCVFVLARLLRRHAPERALAGTCLFALNPLVLYETVGNGHNDIVLVLCLLLMAAALARGKHSLAVVALTAGVLVKYIPILLVPVLLAYSLRALPDRRARLRYLLVSGAVCGLLAVAAWAPFWRGGDIAAIGRRTVLFTTSLPAFIDTHLRAELGGEQGRALSRYLVSRAALMVTVLAAYFVSWHTWQRTAFALSTSGGRARAWQEPLRTGQMLLLFYLLVTCLWFQPWYALWPLALAALLPESTLVYLALVLAYAAGWKTFYLDFFLNPPQLTAPVIYELVLGPLVMAFPWLYAVLAVARELGRRGRKRAA